MVKQISKEKRNNIKAALLNRDSIRAVAKSTGISKSTVGNYSKRLNITCTSKGGRPKKISERSGNHIARSVKIGKSPNATNVARSMSTDDTTIVSSKT
ncbi:unnamed protein product [Cunninghamella blakesleeana]